MVDVVTYKLKNNGVQLVWAVTDYLCRLLRDQTVVIFHAEVGIRAVMSSFAFMFSLISVIFCPQKTDLTISYYLVSKWLALQQKRLVC